MYLRACELIQSDEKRRAQDSLKRLQDLGWNRRIIDDVLELLRSHPEAAEHLVLLLRYESALVAHKW
jgi:predicted RNA binding protein with dsRBD fold (UPF0201 family)